MDRWTHVTETGAQSQAAYPCTRVLHVEFQQSQKILSCIVSRCSAVGIIWLLRRWRGQCVTVGKEVTHAVGKIRMFPVVPAIAESWPSFSLERFLKKSILLKIDIFSVYTE